jgi:hypothetical protein
MSMVVECKRRVAVGCEPADECILEGISLCVLRGDDDDPKRYPDMSIRVTDDAISQVGMMIDDAPADLWGRDIRVACSVCAVQGDAMVIRLAFTGAGAAFRAYHLVYHSADASFLFMLPFSSFGVSTNRRRLPSPAPLGRRRLHPPPLGEQT